MDLRDPSSNQRSISEYELVTNFSFDLSCQLIIGAITKT